VNYQEKAIVNNIIDEIKENKREKIISLDNYDIIVFRNLYHIAKNIEHTLDAEIVEKGKSFCIFNKI
jgi:hypothetical protein